jgi:alpha-ketoglutarate-dependent taurine dioxygenase
VKTIEGEEPRTRRPIGARRQAVDVVHGEAVSIESLDSGRRLPAVIRPATDQVDLADWVLSQRQRLETLILEHGAILFRGFPLRSVPDFEAVALAFYGDLYAEYGDLPREGVSGKIYASTPYPNDQMILYHNESSHLHRWPMKIGFFCVQAAEEGGSTPLLDCRSVTQAIDPEIFDEFARKGVTYIRNFSPGLDVPWQEFFHTEDRAAVEESCRRDKMECEWTGGGGLRIRQTCKAVTRHPKTGETVFFNQVQLHHDYCVGEANRRSLLSLFVEEDLPRRVTFGDGTRIPDSVMAHLGEVFERLAVRSPWQAGDVVILENMLTSHARDPFRGPRKIVVAMGQMISSEELEAELDRFSRS